MDVTRSKFGAFHNQVIWLYTLTNDNGIKLKVMNYGATLTNLEMPDKHEKNAKIIIGSDRFEDYLKEDAYFGATVGRVAGRITSGRFSIDNTNYQLPLNDGKNTNHGGPDSFDRQLWNSHPFSLSDKVGVRFDLFSPNGTNGFPGNLNISVFYSLNQKNEWQLHYEATTDKPTLFNPTNHVYFNLSGNLVRTVDNHLLKLASHQFGEINQDGTPTGKLIDVNDTPFDFTKNEAISKGIKTNFPQSRLVNGYDHPFLLDRMNGQFDAVLQDPVSSRQVTMKTTNNAVVVYSGNALSDHIIMDGRTMRPHLGITLEAQMMPDAINHKGFGNIVLLPGSKYEADTIYQFGLVETWIPVIHH